MLNSPSMGRRSFTSWKAYRQITDEACGPPLRD